MLGKNTCKIAQRRKNLLLLIVLSSSMTWISWTVDAEEKQDINLVTNGGFEQGIAGWEAYRKEAPKSILSQSSEEAYAGKYSLKVETPLTNLSRGARIHVKVTPMNNYSISIYAKGEEKVMLCVSGSGGLTYGKHINLTSEWQELRLKKFEKSNSFCLYVIAVSKNQKSTFYLDNVKVVREADKELAAVDVEPVWYEAEDYKHNAWIVKNNSVSGGAYAEGKRWYLFAADVPLPQTAKPVYVYIKTWIDDNSKNYVSIVHGEPPRQTVFKKKLPAPKEWIWFRMGPLNAKGIGEAFSISSTGPDALTKVRLDALVVTTMGNLTNKELQNLEKEQ